MRTIKNLDVPQNSDAKFPFSTIQNETDTLNGTPVVEEIYGDLLTNIYKLLQSVGITPTETQDSDTSQYQILQALQQLPNSLNDIEQVLSLTATTWSVNLDLEILPNKYFFFARASENYVVGTTYSFEGTDENPISFTSSGFKASDELLVIIDADGVRAYSLSLLSGAKEEVFSVLGQPLSYNDSDKMYYFEDGKLYSDTPSINDLQTTIRNCTIILLFSLTETIICDVIINQGHVLCLCYIPALIKYFFMQFDLNNLSTPSIVNIGAVDFASSADYKPYIYANQNNIYISNNLNSSAEDFKLQKFQYDAESGELAYISDNPVNNTFVKSTNVVIKENDLYALIEGNLRSYNLIDESLTAIGIFPNALGRLISFNGNTYFLNGEVAKKWDL
jgi:hypothetical protein